MERAERSDGAALSVVPAWAVCGPSARARSAATPATAVRHRMLRAADMPCDSSAVRALFLEGGRRERADGVIRLHGLGG